MFAMLFGTVKWVSIWYTSLHSRRKGWTSWESGKLRKVRSALLQVGLPPLVALRRLVEQQRGVPSQLLQPGLPILLHASQRGLLRCGRTE